MTLAVAALFAGCTTTSAALGSADDRNLTVDEAHRVVAAYESREAAGAANDPLAKATTLDDALEILKRDELALFPKGVEIAAKDGSPKGKVLQAQIELAWGEGQHILSDLFARVTRNLRDDLSSLQRMQAARPLTEAERARLGPLEKTLAEVAGISSALSSLGDAHIANGITLAQAVIAQAPDDYTGYRVAADFYRLREDWVKFDESVVKLQALNPTSNGLVFARAMEAISRNGDRAKAVELLNQALTADPKFIRARAQLVLVHSSLDSAWKEFQALKASTPNHPIVTWVGPALEAEHRSYEEQARRLDASALRALERIPR